MPKPPTIPLYVRIPVDLRQRLEAARTVDGDWRTRRIQDLVIDALYATYPAPDAPKPTQPDEPTAKPARAVIDEKARRRAARRPPRRRARLQAAA